jgi:putative oxidoreductase
MIKAFQRIISVTVSPRRFNTTMLVFRVLLSLELIVVHGLKKIGIDVPQAERVPNPLHFSETFNTAFAISANLFFPVLVMLGLFTRIAIIPILAVTLTGYFVVHWKDALLVKDTPFMYSLSYLFILFVGPGSYSVDYWMDRKRIIKVK